MFVITHYVEEDCVAEAAVREEQRDGNASPGHAHFWVTPDLCDPDAGKSQ